MSNRPLCAANVGLGRRSGLPCCPNRVRIALLLGAGISENTALSLLLAKLLSIPTPPDVELPPVPALMEETSLTTPRVYGAVAVLLAMEVFNVRVELLCRDRVMGRMLRHCQTEGRLKFYEVSERGRESIHHQAHVGVS